MISYHWFWVRWLLISTFPFVSVFSWWAEAHLVTAGNRVMTFGNIKVVEGQRKAPKQSIGGEQFSLTFRKKGRPCIFVSGIGTKEDLALLLFSCRGIVALGVPWRLQNFWRSEDFLLCTQGQAIMFTTLSWAACLCSTSAWKANS